MADKKVRYLNPIDIETKAERYCRFRKKGIKYIDYKDADFLLMCATLKARFCLVV